MPCLAQGLLQKSHVIISGRAQTLNVKVAALQEQNRDLPSGSFILETSDHTMWFGTYSEGLIAWDGAHFIHYHHRNQDSSSLPHNEIYFLGEADGTHVWVGTKNGLALLDRVTQKFIPYRAEGGGLISYGYVRQGPDGRTYVASDHGLGIVDERRHIIVRQDDAFVHLKTSGHDSLGALQVLRCILFDRRGGLWGISENAKYSGLCHFDFKKQQWILHPPYHINLNQPAIDKTYTHQRIGLWTMCADPDGERLWMGGWASGLLCYHLSTGTFDHAVLQKDKEQPLWINTIQHLAVKNDSELYVGTYHCLEIINTATWTAKNYSVQSRENGTVHTMRDHCGNLWFTCNNTQFGRINALSDRFHPVAQLHVPHVQISATYTTRDGTLWVANFQQAGNDVNENFVYTFRNNKLVARYTFPGQKPAGTLGDMRSFYQPADGTLYAFGGDGHAYRADTARHEFYKVPIRYVGDPANYHASRDEYTMGYDHLVHWSDSVFFAMHYNSGGVGIGRINLRSRTAIQYAAPIAQYGIRDCYARLALCSERDGINLFHPETGALVSYRFRAGDTAGLPTDAVRNVVQARDSSYFFSTDAGLVHAWLTPGRKAVFRLIIRDVACRDIRSGLGDDVWISSDKGQLRLNTRTLQYRFYNADDGYRWNGRRFDLPGGMWLMSDGSILDPRRIAQNRFLPKPLPAGFSVFDKPYVSDTFSALKKEFQLRHDENFFSISYSCDAYINEPRNRYAYKLEGFDTGWVQAEERTTAYYTGVAPGRYRFRVKAANSDGLWGEPVTLHTIIIIPAWYQTWWFETLAVLSTLALLLLLFRLRLNAVKARAREQQIAADLAQTKAQFEQQIAETEMAALRAQMNPHFIFNVLNSINKYILTSEPHAASDYLNSFSRLIRLVLENSKSMKVPLATDVEALRLYINMEQLRFSNRFDYQICIPQEVDQQYTQVPPLLIQPYVENAIWHGLMQKDAGEKHLRIIVSQPEEEQLEIVVEDNGIGRKAAAKLKSKSATQHKSFGLQITKDRIAIVNKLYNIRATVTIEDMLDKDSGSAVGTRVTIVIPV